MGGSSATGLKVQVKVNQLKIRISQALILCVVLSGGVRLVRGQNVTATRLAKRESHTARLAKLVEANVIATHAYQILLSKKFSRGDPACLGQENFRTRSSTPWLTIKPNC